jgi:hypothetical protein
MTSVAVAIDAKRSLEGRTPTGRLGCYCWMHTHAKVGGQPGGQLRLGGAVTDNDRDRA